MTKRLVLGMPIAVAGLVVLAAGMAPFLVGCERTSEVEEADASPTAPMAATSAAQATPTVTPGLAEVDQRRAEEERVMLEDQAKPKFEGIVNGIRIYPTGAAASERKWACTDAKPEEVQHVEMSAVAGTPMEIVPTYLPSGAEEALTTLPPAVCRGTLAYVEREWVVRDAGAQVFINRREGEQAIGVDAPADRISGATVGGKPAVLVTGLAVKGDDYSSVILAEDFGITAVGVLGLPLDEAVKIAEGLK